MQAQKTLLGFLNVYNAMNNFTDLQVWQKSHRLFLDFIKDIGLLPNNRVTTVLIDQTVRSVSSISANIAEGFASRNPKEYCRYLDIARKSASESENWFLKFRDSEIMEKTLAQTRIDACIEISKMIYGLIKSIKNPHNSKL